MSLREYTTPAEDKMRFGHDAQIRFTVTAGRKVLEDRLTSVATIGGAIATAGIIYNRLSMSGGVSWWDPSTGESISRPKIQMRVRSKDVLTGDQLCCCSSCK